MVAVPLIFGRLTADDYEDDVARDPRIDALRAKMAVTENRGASAATISIPTSARSATRCKCSSTTELDRARRRRLPDRPSPAPRGRHPAAAREVPARISRRASSAAQIARIEAACAEQNALEAMAVHEFIALWVSGREERRARRLRAAAAARAPLQIPGPINAYCALLAERAGFEAIYLSGAGVANASFGLPDFGVTTLNDVLEDARRITAATELPLLVDVDTGLGGAFNIARTIARAERAGRRGRCTSRTRSRRSAAAIGRTRRRSSAAEMCDRLKAAVDARSGSSVRDHGAHRRVRARGSAGVARARGGLRRGRRRHDFRRGAVRRSTTTARSRAPSACRCSRTSRSSASRRISRPQSSAHAGVQARCSIRYRVSRHEQRRARTSTRRCASTARSARCSTRCRRARSSTTCSVTTRTSASSTSCMRARRRAAQRRLSGGIEGRRAQEGGQGDRTREAAMSTDTSGARGRPARRFGRRDSDLDGRRRSWAALPRLRHRRARRRKRRSRRSRICCCDGELPTARRARRVRARSALAASCRPRSARCSSGFRPARIRWTCCARAAPCSARSSPSATSRRSSTLRTGLIAAFPGCCCTGTTSRTSGRRIATATSARRHRGALSRAAARRAAERAARARARCVADPVRRARVQRVDVRRSRLRRHAVRFLFGRDGRDRHAARAAARRRERGGDGAHRALRLAGRRRARRGGDARRARRRSWASAMPCTEPRIRATP